ncbi:hypothetical protein THAOC_18898 [Thalassiosira oceanica]|uniref:Uncharacterized protein n=1 Tax=Thalassiosira oceanica TaxID=159749 RepID=K0SI88_THAOC|nr:hypothetical protein THAOC_18898 [Thalassiosira oceanica]|eukprot:EJK60696.1 hypothetical protein THAOC_18898 [Thalassiosira oceanica]
MDVGTLTDGLSPNIHRSTAIASIIPFACFRLLRIIRFSIAWYHKHYCAKAYGGAATRHFTGSQERLPQRKRQPVRVPATRHRTGTATDKQDQNHDDGAARLKRFFVGGASYNQHQTRGIGLDSLFVRDQKRKIGTGAEQPAQQHPSPSTPTRAKKKADTADSGHHSAEEQKDA